MANLCNNFDKRAYEPVDDADAMTCRPDFALPIYPAYLALKDKNNELAPELKVTTNTPPIFLVQTADGAVRCLPYGAARQSGKQ